MVYDELSATYFGPFFKQLGSMQDEDSFDSFILKAFQNKSQDGHFCIHAMFLDVIKRMKLKTNLVFRICLVVACGFLESPDMAVNKFRKPSIFQVGKCIINFPSYWLRMRRNRTQIWRSGGDANLLSSRAAFFRQAQTYAAQYGRELLEHATEPDIDIGKSAN